MKEVRRWGIGALVLFALWVGAILIVMATVKPIDPPDSFDPGRPIELLLLLPIGCTVLYGIAAAIRVLILLVVSVAGEPPTASH